jgi:hypothetical protein
LKHDRRAALVVSDDENDERLLTVARCQSREIHACHPAARVERHRIAPAALDQTGLRVGLRQGLKESVAPDRSRDAACACAARLLILDRDRHGRGGEDGPHAFD